MSSSRRPDFRLLFTGLVASMVAESILLLALIGWVVDRCRRRPFLVAAT